MANTQNHVVAAKLRGYAKKIAAEKLADHEGGPDRLTVADGQGGISTAQGIVPTDAGEGEIKRDQPTDGTGNKATQVPGSGPDRLTSADGQGGIDASRGTVPTDPGEEELKKEQPADGTVRKAAGLSNRALHIRAALTKANPALGARIEKTAGEQEQEQARLAAEKQAHAPSIEFSQETLAKIASTILSTDEGIQFTHDLLEKDAGEQAAGAQIMQALEASETVDQVEQVKQAAFQGFDQNAQEIYQNLAEAQITEEDADSILKQAAAHQVRIASYEHPLLKRAYAQGMDDAALLAAADEAAAEEEIEGIEGAPPGVDEAMPMGGEELGEEEIVALLQEMIANGEITEEDIMAAISATEGDPAEGAPELV